MWPHQQSGTAELRLFLHELKYSWIAGTQKYFWNSGYSAENFTSVVCGHYNPTTWPCNSIDDQSTSSRAVTGAGPFFLVYHLNTRDLQNAKTKSARSRPSPQFSISRPVLRPRPWSRDNVPAQSWYFRFPHKVHTNIIFRLGSVCACACVGCELTGSMCLCSTCHTCYRRRSADATKWSSWKVWSWVT